MREPRLAPPELDALTCLASLADPQVDALRKMLEAAPVLVSSRSAFIRGVAPVDGIKPDDQKEIVWALAHLGAYAGGSDGVTADLVDSVRSQLAKHGVNESEASRVGEILPGLLGVASVRLRSKAAYLRTDHARAFKRARVLTDLRPIFGLDGATAIEGAVVMHTLKLEYYQDDFVRGFFVTLDDVDLEALLLVVMRAQEKAKALRTSISNCLTDFSREGDA